MNTKQAYKFGNKHKESTGVSETCGCFHCIKRFSPEEIEAWIDEGQTAICPRCGIDAVIFSSDVPSLTDSFLRKMQAGRFGSSTLISQDTIIELIGWVGTVTIVLAYALLNFKKLDASDISYQTLNIAGSSGLIISALHKKDYQPVALNIVWILVALIALLA